MENNSLKQKSSKLGHHTGSFINWMMSSNSSIPVVGMGATQMHWTDRDPFEVIEVSDDTKRVVIRSMDYTWDKTLGCGAGHQNWILSSNPNGATKTLYWRWGAWRTKSIDWKFTDAYEIDCDYNREHMERMDFLSWMKDVDQNKSNYPQYVSLYTEWSIIRIFFGRAEYYYDWSF